MMKLARSLAIGAVAVVAGYSAFWYYQAERIQAGLQQHMEKITAASSLDVRFEYEALEKSGFPFGIQIALLNPKIKIQNRALTEEDAKTVKSIDCALQGKITDTFSLLGNLTSVVAEGAATLQVPASEYEPAANFLAQGRVEADIQAAGSVLDSMARSFDERVQDVKSFRVHFSPLQFTKMQEGKMVAQLDVKKGDFSYEKEKHKQLIKMASDATFKQNFAVNLPNMTNGLKAIIDPLNELLSKKSVSTDLSGAFAIELPDFATLQAIAMNPALLTSERIPTFSFELIKYESKNEYGTAQAHGKCSLGEDEHKKVASHFLFDTSSTTNPLYYKQAIDLIDELASAANKIPLQEASEPARIKKILCSHVPELKALVPKFQELSPIECKFAWDMEANKENYDAKFQLQDLAFLTHLYGLQFGGEAEYRAGSISGKSTLELTQYKRMLQDTIGYYNKAALLVNELKIEGIPQLKTLSQGIIQKLAAYFQKISNDPAHPSENIATTLSYKDGSAKIGTMSWAEFSAYSEQVFKEIHDELWPPAPAALPASPKGAAA